MSGSVTPMMAQYLEIKKAHQDALLFYRMGDFYELFFNDAVLAAEALDIALTKRGKHLGEDIAMCGVPFHAAEGYLLTLIRKGFRVAVCEQLESPAEAKKRGYKAVVKRGVTRVVTPGTLTEESLLDARRHNFLAAYADIRGEGALAWVDISTGSFSVLECDMLGLSPELSRLSPKEILISQSAEEEFAPIAEQAGASVTVLGAAAFDSTNGEKRLADLFSVTSMAGFGAFSRVEISALAAIIEYLEITQKGKLPVLRPPQKERRDAAMQIDAATRKSLELVRGANGGRAGSLVAVIDKTLTAGGARLLERRLSSPSCDLEEISHRHDAITWWNENSAFLDDSVERLKRTPDLDRALSRLSLDRGGPRDLASVRDALEAAAEIADGLPETLPFNLMGAAQALIGYDDIADQLNAALIAAPPLLTRDGGFVAAGFDTELDEFRSLRDEGRSVIAGLQTKYAELADVSSLKVKHNNVLGYFVEVTALHGEKLLSAPLSEVFIHRQTTANQVRFTTLELSGLETKILNAGGRCLEIEKRVFGELQSTVLKRAPDLFQLSRALAEVDFTAALARLAKEERWVRPQMSKGREFDISQGRHPVVEAALTKGGDPFVANDCDLSDDHIWLLTGPNMAGKSTYLRQNALMAILAQMGSFVPASRAKIGLVSQVFSRVGASDDLSKGQSTFMVEMVETAAILNQADDRALVILDEIGRGTATYDGLSIAWATLEHLHAVNRCRTLFATHYHEMTQLSEKLSGVANATVRVKEWEGDVIFLHEVARGTADRSYGVQVARLAGLPISVVERANIVLSALEQGEREGQSKVMIEDLPLFSVQPSQPQKQNAPSILEARLKEVSPDDLSPKQALDLLYELRDLASSSG